MRLRILTMMIAALCSGALVLAAQVNANDAGQTRERGAQPASTPSTMSLSCPQAEATGSWRPVTTSCPKCRPLADRINGDIPFIQQKLRELNEAIGRYNEACAKLQEMTKERDPLTATPVKEGEPVYCGPDVTAIFMESIQKVHERLKMLPDTEKGLLDGASPFDSFLLRNGTNIDQKPLLSSFAGRAQCPTGPCAAAGNSKGQDCFMLWGQCVPQHVMNDIMFGFVADQTYVPELVQKWGGHYHEYNARKNWDPDTSTQSYYVGDEISEEIEDDGTLDQDFAKEKMQALMKTVAKDYPETAKCLPCPAQGTVTKWKAGFHTRDWTLADGSKLVKEGYITDKGPKRADEEADGLKAIEALERTVEQLKARVREAQGAFDRAADTYRQLVAQLAACEEDCKIAEKTEETIVDWFGGNDVISPDDQQDAEAEGFTPQQIKECPECARIAAHLSRARERKFDLVKQQRAKNAEKATLQPKLNEAKAKLERLQKSLGTEEGVGGEAVDPATGVRTTSYDNGRGQVEIKRFDKNGRQIGETEYRSRPSTADRRRQLEQAQAEYEALARQMEPLEAAIKALQEQIDGAQRQIEQLQQQLAACLERCKKGPVDDGGRAVKVGGDVKVELEDARSESGTNAFDPNAVRDIGHGGGTEVVRPPVTEPVREEPVVEPVKPVEPVREEPIVEPVEPIKEEPIVEPVKPVEPLEPIHEGQVSFNHVVQESSCPQDAGGIRVRAASGHSLTIVEARVGGAIAPKLQLMPQGNNSPSVFVKALFNCSSPENGTFTGQISITIKDVQTGQTATVNAPASGSVTGP